MIRIQQEKNLMELATLGSDSEILINLINSKRWYDEN